MSVRAAHDERRRILKEMFPDTWPKVFSDKSRLPTVFWVYAHYRKFMDSNYGTMDGPDAFMKAEDLISNFKKMCQEENSSEPNKSYAKIKQTDTGETIVAIVDPFMHRVHEVIPQSGEIVMMDATSNLDR